ncbi:MAG: hypothetical protein WCE79_23810 [Xanthobacteraceae bacterium]
MPEKAAQNIQLGVPFDETSHYFFLSLAVGAAVVFFFSLKKFGESTVDKSEDDFIARLPIKYLASHDVYARAMLLYIGVMVLTLTAFSLLGPSALGLGGDKVPETATSVLPLFVALILVGIIPNFSMLQSIERRIRQFAHERAYIPASARAMAERMAAAEFAFERYATDAILGLPLMADLLRSDLGSSRGSLEYSWARLCCLSYEMQWGKAAELIGTLEELRNSLEEKRQALAKEIGQYRQQRAATPGYTNEKLHQNTRKVLRELHLLLGCAVRAHSSPNTDINVELNKFGFVLDPTPSPDPKAGDVIVAGLGIMTFSLLVLGLGAAALGLLWKTSNYFPSSALDAFLWAASAGSAHASAIVIAHLIRSRSIRGSRWVLPGDRPGSQLANCIRVAAACAAGGYVVLMVWGVIYQGTVTAALLKGMAAYALMPAATGGFYILHLDNVASGRRPSRLIEICLQASVTAFCGLAACCAWLTLVGERPLHNYDLVLMVTLFGAVIGGSLAWYIPEAVPDRKFDPLADAREQRIRALESAAIVRFQDPALAKIWLDQSDVRLGNQTPRQAAGRVETYEDAVGLLYERKPRLAA